MPDETWRPQPDDDLVAKLRRGWWLYESGEIRDMQNEAADEIERLRKALTDIVENDSRGRGCSTYTKGSCREDPGRTLLSGYGATSWCDSCIAMDALTSPETPPSPPESAPEAEPVTGQRPTTYDLTEGQEFRKAIADAERGALEAIDPLAVPFSVRRAFGLDGVAPSTDPDPLGCGHGCHKDADGRWLAIAWCPKHGPR